MRTHPIVKHLVAAALVVAASAAQAASVKYDYDATADFSAWKRFAWKRPEPPRAATLAEGRIRRALEAGLVADGFEKSERSEADFLVDSHAVVGRELRVDEGIGPRWRRDVRVASYPVGTLVVDVYDRASGRLVWRGAVSDALASDPEKAERKTAKAVAKLLGKFPPPAND